MLRTRAFRQADLSDLRSHYPAAAKDCGEHHSRSEALRLAEDRGGGREASPHVRQRQGTKDVFNGAEMNGWNNYHDAGPP